MNHITEVFENALGSSASDFAAGGVLSSSAIESLREFYLEWLRGKDDFNRPENELWPLISHHDDVDGAVVLRNFVAGKGSSSTKNPRDELAMHLVACNGVVLADPLRRIFFDVDGKSVSSPRSEDIHRVAANLGQIEALIQANIIGISKVHPLLNSESRQAWISPFNLGPNLKVLTDLIEEGYWLPNRPTSEQQVFPEKVALVLQSCGVRPKDLPSGLRPLEAINAFARALMEVSWQLANATQSGADLYLTSALERRIFDVLLEYCVDQLAIPTPLAQGPEGNGQHLHMLATVGIPLLDSEKITFGDIVDIRSGDAFSSWRNTLTDALNTYVTSKLIHDSEEKACSHFASKIRTAADQLNAKASDKSLRKALRNGTGSFGIGAIATLGSQFVAHSPSATTTFSFVSAGSLATLMWNYLNQRNTGDKKAALRFVAAFDL